MFQKTIDNFITNISKKYTDYIFITLLLVLILFLFFPTLTGEYSIVTPDFGQSDILQDGYPTKVFVFESLKKFTLPLWNPLVGTGYPMDGYPTGVWYPLNIVLFLLFPSSIAFHAGLALSILIAGIGTYIFAKLHQMRAYAAFISAVSFSLSATMIVHLNHYSIIQSISLFPWMLIAVHYYIEKNKLLWIYFLAFITGCSITIGFYQLILYSLLFTGIYAIFQLTKKYNSRTKHSFFYTTLYLLMGLFLGIGLGAIQLLPSIQLLQTSIRQYGIDDQIRFMFPFPIKHFLSFIYPYLFGDPRNGTYPSFSSDWGIFWENTGYIGLIPLCLAILGIFSFRSKKRIIFWILCTTVLGTLIVGKYTPAKIFFQIPPFSFFRIPSRFLFFLVFLLSLFAGRGLMLISSMLGKLRYIVVSFLLIVTIINLLWFGKTYHLQGKTKDWFSPPETVQLLKQDKSWYRIASTGNSYLWNNIFTKSGWINKEIEYIPLLNALDPNYNVLFDIPHFSIYDDLPTQRGSAIRNVISKVYDENSSLVFSKAGKSILNQSGVKYILSPFDIKDYTLIRVAASTTPPHIFIYQNTAVFPHVWITHTVQKMDTFNQVVSAFSNPDTEQTVSYIEGPIPTIDPKGTGTAEIIKDTATEIVIKAILSRQGILILSDSYYPGWNAFIDGKKTPIYPANINQKSIVVPEGEHTILFTYQSTSFIYGTIISALSLGILIFLTVTSSFKIIKRKHTHDN